MTEDELVGWHHRLNGHEFEQAPGVGDGQGSLACCSPWGHKESDTTERLNNNSVWTVTPLPHLFLISIPRQISLKIKHSDSASARLPGYLPLFS